jgi:hypothetical protein
MNEKSEAFANGRHSLQELLKTFLQAASKSPQTVIQIYTPKERSLIKSNYVIIKDTIYVYFSLSFFSFFVALGFELRA